MKRILFITVILSTITLGLMACSNENADESNEEQPSSATENSGKQDETNTDIEGDENEEKEEDKEDSNSKFNVESEDQLDLGIGDTGTFDTTLGTYDITIVSAKLEDEIDGTNSELDKFLYLDIIVKNTSQETQKVEDLLHSMEASHERERSGFSDASDYFNSLEKMSGELAPGEEISGQFVTMVYDSEEYYFRKDPGNVAAGSSNQVIWTIKADEVR
ncbi:protein of unknown function [Oceanobacillus limi]|uniref:DUF4352 domain-containing protein n=1 Tax=Oceanobacillus limi TaxID=930131 RepID=A0A1I0FVB4_9BACI|nr:hypothetical protein [Oceanobacillus limi]SET62417.1 protein of unknown function [Oceanobacillus limi]